MTPRPEPAPRASIGGITRRRFLAGAAASPLAGLAGCSSEAEGPTPPPERVFSFFSVGDIGKPQNLAGPWARQNQKGLAMTRLHRADPAEGLVLLGDHFYPDGLVPFEAEARIGENLVAPYGAFLRCSERARAAFECDPEPIPVPIDAVPGNHDHGTLGTVPYQARVVPQYVENFTLHQEPVVVVERPGISLVLIDAIPWLPRHEPLLARALRDCRGPLVAIASHLPVADPGNNYSPVYASSVLAAIRSVGRTVHLYLCGHEHNLQVHAMPEPGPRAHLILGGGASPRPVRENGADRLFGWSGIGFGRVHVLGGTAPQAHVDLYGVDMRVRWWTARARRLARVVVAEDGATRVEPASAGEPVA